MDESSGRVLQRRVEPGFLLAIGSLAIASLFTIVLCDDAWWISDGFSVLAVLAAVYSWASSPRHRPMLVVIVFCCVLVFLTNSSLL